MERLDFFVCVDGSRRSLLSVRCTRGFEKQTKLQRCLFDPNPVLSVLKVSWNPFEPLPREGNHEERSLVMQQCRESYRLRDRVPCSLASSPRYDGQPRHIAQGGRIHRVHEQHIRTGRHRRSATRVESTTNTNQEGPLRRESGNAYMGRSADSDETREEMQFDHAG